jgi:H-type small acid-soluble spore protein
MTHNRINEILRNKELHEIFYNNRPVWIQELQGNTAKVGFVDNNEEKDVYIEDLYEDNLYNKS